jgi:hypothetical protein
MKAALGWLVRSAPRGLGLALVIAALAGSAYAGPPSSAAHPRVPEIDPGSIGSALTLLIGGAFLLTGKARKR